MELMNKNPAAEKSKTPRSKQIKRLWGRLIVLTVAITVFTIIFAVTANAASVSVDINSDTQNGAMSELQLLFLFVLLALAPSLLMMMTSFTRIVIVLSLLRNAIGLQQTPPNQVIIGLALALSLFIMAPVISTVNKDAIEPLQKGKITEEVALERMQDPIKEFMLKQTKDKDLNMFLSLAGDEEKVEGGSTESLKELSLSVIVPAFITSELKRAFTMGFLLFLPFLVIDMIVSSTLMSMGMVMLPPSMISLPFKLMLFVVVDGWGLLIETLITSFN
jgi:flagellar biosynthetic protein FliP